MPSKHGTLCPDPRPSPVADLAAMIDKRTRNYRPTAPRFGATARENPRRLETGMQPRDGSVLLWLDGNDARPPETPVGRHRGVIVAAHGSCQGITESAFIISYPIATDDRAQHLPALSGLLEEMGWTVMALGRAMTEGETMNTAVLANTPHFGPKQVLWLAELVGLAQARCPGAPTLMPRLSAASTGADLRIRDMRKQVAAWVNLGGAGDEAAS